MNKIIKRIWVIAALAAVILLFIMAAQASVYSSVFAGTEEGVEVVLPEQTIKPEFDFDSDELFRQYAEKEFDIKSDDGQGSTAMARTALRRERLNTQEKIVYDILKGKIENIAAGNDDYAVVDIPLESLGVQQSYTASELGLESIFDENDPSVITETARQAVNSKFQVGLMNILSAVMGDMPYELYWYDKTTGIAFEPPKIIGVNNGSGGALVFDTGAKVAFKMYVSADYSRSGLLQTFYADRTKTGAASAASENAKAIVQKYIGLSDYEKLDKYKEEVITLTDYNYQAVEDYGLYGIYGDPWQLIHVFDGDPDTKVVCEGYAKAFQYLCDQSDFDDGSLICNCTTGDMLAENGAGGPHMWNTVSIGGVNFIVDLTNNDNVTDDPEHKAPTDHDELFMAGAEGSFESGIYMISWDDDDPDRGPYYIQYIYDEDTLRYFDEDELTISDKSYLRYIEDLGKEYISVRMSLLGDSYHRSGAEVHTLRAGNLTEWISESSYEVLEGSSVLDVLNLMLKKGGFSGNIDYSGYVSSISDGDSRVLSEKDNGQYSGWMYTLNGSHVNKSVKEQEVSDGDVVVFHYTDDYRLDDDSLDVSEAESVIEMIRNLPENLSLEDAQKINEAAEALEDLDSYQPVLSGMVTSDVRARLNGALERLEELKKEAEEDAEEKAIEELNRMKADSIISLKDMADRYAGKVLPQDREELIVIFIDAAKKINDAATISDIESIISVSESRIKALVQKKVLADKKAKAIAKAKKYQVKGLKVRSKSRKLRISWKKTKGASGYQVQYRIRGKKWNTLKKTAKLKAASGKLKRNKKYQVRVRTYTKTYGTVCYGKWTGNKNVICK